MPCRISVYEEGGKVKIATIRPTHMLKMFDDPGFESVAHGLEETIIKIIGLALS